MKWGAEDIFKKASHGQSLEGLREKDDEAFKKEQDELIERERQKIRDEFAQREKEWREKMDGFKNLASRSEEFLGEIDGCFQNFYAAHKDDKKYKKQLETYDKLLGEIRQAIALFLSDLTAVEKPGEGTVTTLDISLDLISDLCRKIYTIDNTFPNFAFLDKDRLINAAREEAGLASEKIESHFFGRFAIIGTAPTREYGSGEYYFFDQQAKKIDKRKAVRIQARENVALVEYEAGFMGDGHRECIFRGRNGKFTRDYSWLRWGVGNLIVGKDKMDYRNDYVIFDENGDILWQNIDEYTPNEKNTRALIKKDYGYNVLLSDGKLMFEKSREVERQDMYFSLGLGGRSDKIYGDTYLKYGDRYFRLNKDLEVVTEGSTLEEVREKKRRGGRKEEELDEEVA